MQGLVDYDSDSGGSGDDAPSAAPPPKPAEPAPRKGLLSSLPPPSTSAPAASKASGGLLSALPPPATKRVVQFMAPVKPPADDEDDEDRPKKIAKTAPAKTGGAASLFASLPKPKNEELGGGATLGGGGAKIDLSDKPSAAAKRSPFAEGLQGDDDDDDETGAAAAPQPEGPQYHAPHPSEMYRVTDAGQPAYAAGADAGTSYGAYGVDESGNAQGYDAEAWAQWAAANPEAAAAYAAQQGWYGYDYGAGAQQQQEAVSADALLQQALADQAAQNAKRKDFDPFAALSALPVKEISQAELTKGREHLIQTKSITGMAFGPEYEAKLRKEAGMKPDNRLRAKHQIGALYWQSKQNELQILEGRLQGMKSKAETQAKYGWR